MAEEAFAREARRLAGVPDAAEVYFYTAENCFAGTSLAVPAAHFRGIRNDKPLVLAEVKAGTSLAALPVIVSVHPLTRDYCDSPAGRAAAAFVASSNTYEVLLSRLPKYVTMPRPVAVDNMDVVPSSECQCGAAYWNKWFVLSPQSVTEALADGMASIPMETLIEALLLYAHEILDLVEQYVIINARRSDPVQTMTRLRALEQQHYARAWDTLGGTSLRHTVAALFPLLIARPREGSVPPRRKGEPRLAFEEEVVRNGNPYCPWTGMWLAASDMRVQHLLGDHELGIHKCPTCSDKVMARVDADLAISAPHVPWVDSIFGDPAAPLAPRVPGTALYALHRPLAWRLPTMVEYRENAADMAPLCELPAVLYGAIPHVLRRFKIEALLRAFDAYSAQSTSSEAILVLAAIQGNTRIETLCKAWDVHAPLCETSTAAITTCRTATPEPLGLTQLRAKWPLASGADATMSFMRDTATTAEEARAWHDGLRERRVSIAARVPDIEDLLGNGALPPCLACSLGATRTAAHANNVERRTLALWGRDMGATPEATARLILGTHADATHMRDLVSQGEYASRLTDKTSLDCKAIMNPMNVGEYGAAITCPVRAQVLGASDTGGKLADDKLVGTIRWRCTRTLRNFSESTQPFAVWHPLDYVTLQLDALGIGATVSM